MKSIAFLSLFPPDYCYYTRKIAAAFTRSGVEARIYHLKEGDLREVISDLFTNRPDCLFGVAISGQDPILLTSGYRTEEQLITELPLICDHLEIPYISFQLDPPVNFSHYKYSDRLIYGHFDKMIVDTLKQGVLPRVTHIPYGVDPEFLNLAPCDKEYDITFLGTHYDLEAIEERWRANYPADVIDKMHHVIAQLQENPYLHLMEIMGDLWQCETSNPSEIYCQIELYLRAKERFDLLIALSDFSVHVFGGPLYLGKKICRTWDEVLTKYPHITVHKGVWFDQSLDIMRKSRIVLNSCPVFVGGTHDRVMNGLAAGAMVVTGMNRHTEELFGEGRGCIYFRYGQWDALKKKIAYYLDHPEICVQENSCAKAILQNHTWDHRVENLCQLLRS